MSTRACKIAFLVVVPLAGCSSNDGGNPFDQTAGGTSNPDDDGRDHDGDDGPPPIDADTSADDSGNPVVDTGDDTTGQPPTTSGPSDSSEGSSEGTGSDDDGSSSSDTGPMGNGDADNDGLPDDDDPFPNDPNLPGVAASGVVYAQTSSALFTMDVVDYTIAQVGQFSFPSGGIGSVTDIAIDQYGVLYAITFDDLHACNPATAQCYHLAALPSSSNGATFVPPGTVDPFDDTLIGIAQSGDWRQLDVVAGVVMQMVLGSYGPGYSSSGDAFSIGGVGTFASVDAGGTFNDVIVEVDPVDGSVIAELATLTGYSSVYGLAGWDGAIFAFDESGAVLEIDPFTGEVTLLAQTPYAWWGAAVGTILPT